MVRFMAADALGNIGSQDAIPYLEEVCKNDNCFVRVSAEEAIEKIPLIDCYDKIVLFIKKSISVLLPKSAIKFERYLMDEVRF